MVFFSVQCWFSRSCVRSFFLPLSLAHLQALSLSGRGSSNLKNRWTQLLVGKLATSSQILKYSEKVGKKGGGWELEGGDTWLGSVVATLRFRCNLLITWFSCRNFVRFGRELDSSLKVTVRPLRGRAYNLQCHIDTHTCTSHFSMHIPHIHTRMRACCCGTEERQRPKKWEKEKKRGRVKIDIMMRQPFWKQNKRHFRWVTSLSDHLPFLVWRWWKGHFSDPNSEAFFITIIIIFFPHWWLSYNKLFYLSLPTSFQKRRIRVVLLKSNRHSSLLCFCGEDSFILRDFPELDHSIEKCFHCLFPEKEAPQVLCIST